MKLARFRNFAQAVSNDETLSSNGHDPRVFRFYKEGWYDEAGALLADEKLISDLKTVWVNPVSYWRGRSQRVCYFRVPELNAVVRLRFQSLPTVPTQKQFGKYVASCYRNSSNEFDATHDSLTELLNRPAFEDTLERAILNALKPLEAKEVSQSSTPSREISAGFTLLAFDLDHFKQVNDSHGHQYGDVVLQAFAWRLQEAVDKLAVQEGLQQTLSRFGGEEFYVLLEGSHDRDATLDFAERIRKDLNTDPLPSQEQWTVLSSEKSLDPATLPHASERKITASIGHTTFSADTRQLEGNSKQIRAKLLKEADTSLYRAKSDGRDCCRSFQDIRDRFARVLEHHPETNIVTIDIGENVDVQVGQEYLVYHPLFIGGQPFIYADGRTKRRLGDYPRKPCGRVAVFSVSNEISFCTVSDNKLVGTFPAGARLEYIPIGFITPHLSDSAATGGAPLLPLADLEQRLFELSVAGEPIVICVFSVKGLERLSVQKGISHANLVLATVYKSIHAHLPVDACASQLKDGQNHDFVTLILGELDNDEVADLISKIVEPLSRITVISVGAYNSSSSGLTDIYAIDFARLASKAGTPIEIFSDTTPATVLQSLRNQDRSAAIDAYKQKWSRLFEQLSPIYKWAPGGLPEVQSCPRRRSALATNRPTRWATRGAPRRSCYAACFSGGNAARYFSVGVSRSRLL